MLTENDIKEQLSLSYLRAVAARARCGCTGVEPDRDSVDVQIRGSGYSGLLSSPQLDIQAKATSSISPENGEIKFPLPIKNYNDLRRTRAVPAILVVLLMPEAENEWLVHSPDSLILKKCAYWYSLLGLPPVGNSSRRTVKIPTENVFDSDVLGTMLEAVSHRLPVDEMLEVEQDA